MFDLLSGKDATAGGYGMQVKLLCFESSSNRIHRPPSPMPCWNTQAPSSQTMVSSVALETLDDALQLIEIG